MLSIKEWMSDLPICLPQLAGALVSCDKFYNLREANLKLNSPSEILNKHDKVDEFS